MYESTLPACTLLRAHSSRRTSSDPRPSHVLCGPMKAAPHGAVHDAGQPHVDRTGCHARRPLGGITGAGRCGGSSAAGFRWPSLAFRSQIYYFRSSRESEARTCIPTPQSPLQHALSSVHSHTHVEHVEFWPSRPSRIECGDGSQRHAVTRGSPNRLVRIPNALPRSAWRLRRPT